MKFKKFTIFMVALTTLLFSGFSYSADIEGAIQNNSPLIYKDGTINGQSLDLSHIVIPDTTFITANSGISTQAAASGITYFEVAGVGSSNVGGWESITQLQTVTALNHGGALLRVAVLQIGLGNPNNGTLGALSVSRYRTDLLCGSDLHLCLVGETIIGYLYYYAFDGQQSGFFTNSSNSVAVPFGFWQDSIFIQ